MSRPQTQWSTGRTFCCQKWKRFWSRKYTTEVPSDLVLSHLFFRMFSTELQTKPPWDSQSNQRHSSFKTHDVSSHVWLVHSRYWLLTWLVPGASRGVIRTAVWIASLILQSRDRPLQLRLKRKFRLLTLDSALSYRPSCDVQLSLTCPQISFFFYSTSPGFDVYGQKKLGGSFHHWTGVSAFGASLPTNSPEAWWLSKLWDVFLCRKQRQLWKGRLWGLVKLK